jgi:hypothetical protein
VKKSIFDLDFVHNFIESITNKHVLGYFQRIPPYLKRAHPQQIWRRRSGPNFIHVGRGVFWKYIHKPTGLDLLAVDMMAPAPPS